MKVKSIVMVMGILTTTFISQAQWNTSSGYLYLNPANPKVGLGTASTTVPFANLHLFNANVLFEGTVGGTPANGVTQLGAGTRMMWIPAKAAFRAGNVGSNVWDDANIGNYSFACGQNTKASGNHSFAGGTASNATNNLSFVYATNSTSSGLNSFVIGASNTASGSYSFASGGASNVSGTYGSAFGSSQTVSGSNATAFGNSNNVAGNYATAFGMSNYAQAYSSFVIGKWCVNPGTYSPNSWAFTDPLFVIGNGTSSGTRKNAVTVLKNGWFGIGTAAPEDIFQVGGGNAKLNMGGAWVPELNYSMYFGFNTNRQSSGWTTATDGTANGGTMIYSTAFGDMVFATLPSTGGTARTGITDAAIRDTYTKMKILGNGNVAIGTPLSNNTENYKLAVNGKIGAKEMKIEITSDAWADFVFEKDYSLMPLKEVETYLQQNKHLPSVPSACEIEENNGIDLGEMSKIQMQKIEELTLYIIEQNKRIEALEIKLGEKK